MQPQQFTAVANTMVLESSVNVLSGDMEGWPVEEWW
jgi:hypothetical protein